MKTPLRLSAFAFLTILFSQIALDSSAQVSISCPADIEVDNDLGLCEAVVMYTAPIGTGSGTNVTTTLTGGLASGSSFPVGTTVVEYTVTNDEGDSDMCTFQVTVNDTEDPVIDCPPDIIVDANDSECTQAVTYPIPTATDNCGPVTVTQIGGLPSGSVFPIGESFLDFQTTDAAGNEGFCRIVVIVNDITPPEITCPATIEVNVFNSCDTTINYTAPIGIDACGPATTIQIAGLGSGSVFPLGTTTETYQVTDADGNTAICSFDITINDGAAPVISNCPADINQVVPIGTCEDVVTFASPTATDNCPGAIISQTDGPVSGSTFPVGSTNIEFTATDGSGNTSVCSFTVTLTENTPPEIICPGDIVISNDAGDCGAIVTYTPPEGTDNCPNPTTSLISGLGSGSFFPVGTSTETYEVTDLSGNVAACSFTVTVEDSEPPLIDCPANIVASADAGLCETTVNFAPPTFTDNCPGGTITQTNGLASGSIFPVGSTTIEFTAEDAAGVLSTCNFEVIVNDDEAPVINCPDDIFVTIQSGTCDTVITYLPPSFSDNCPGATINLTGGPASGDLLNVGSYTVFFESVDASGNTATCSFSIEIEENNSPTFDCPDDIEVNADPGLCEAVVTFDPPIADDSCSDVTVTQTGGPVSGSTFPAGSTSIEFTAEDEFGNTEVCTFNILVIDDTDPTISCPEDISIGNDPLVCGAIVTYSAPIADDNCSVAEVNLLSGLASGDLFPIGINTVTYEVVDVSGNTAQCTFTVTVTDEEAPLITCPTDITVNVPDGDCSGIVNFADATATDNCAIAAINQTGGLPSGSDFPVGPNTVTFEAIDANGLSASCSFTILILENVAPEINCPANIEVDNDPGMCSAIITYTEPMGTDDCGGASTTLTSGLGSGAEFPVGVTTEEYTVTDLSGNTTTCSFTVTVNDAESPLFDCPDELALGTDPGECGATYSFELPTASDNCPGEVTIVQTSGPASGTELPIGTTTFSFEGTDNAGNITECAYDVVVSDSEAPVFTECPNDISIILDPNQCDTLVEFELPIASDNCGATISQTGGPASGDVLSAGSVTVQFTATDDAGNSAICEFEINVQDVTVPIITCPESFTSCDLVIDIPLPTATDSCGIASITQTGGPSTGTEFPVGVSTITFEAVDVNGNSASCSFEVEILQQATRPQLGQDRTVCGTTSVTLSGNTPDFGSGLWFQIEGTGTIISPENAVTQVKNLGIGLNTFVWSIDPENGCEVLTDSINIFLEEDVVVDAGEDQTILLGGDAQLSSFVAPPNGGIEWSPPEGLTCTNCLDPIASPNETTVYFLTYETPSGCLATDSLTINLIFNIPNTITPDGDNVNDVWNIPEIGEYPDVTVQIFNRWGIEVFSSTGYNEPWDGSAEGEDLPTGSYYYIIDYNREGRENLNGTVNIIR